MTRKRFLLTVAVASGGAPVFFANEQRRLPAQVRIGIIGLEGHYSEISGASKLLPNVRITAVCDAKRASAFRDARPYTDFRRMLAEEELDMVAVCGENRSRARIVEGCAERRLPIIAEKPLALSLSDLEAVRSAIERHRVPLTMLLTMRCSPPYQRMRELVQSGEIGEVISMDAQKSYKLGTRPDWMKKRESFGGSIPYVGIHMLDLMRWISGRDFKQVAAFHSNVGSPAAGEMENNAALAFKLDNGGSATMRIDYLRPAIARSHGDDRLRIVGTRGIVEFKEGNLTLITDSSPLVTLTDLPAAKSLVVDFVESIYLGKPHLLSTADIFRISEIVLKAREAADSGTLLNL